MSFTDSSTGDVTSWLWNFGDGATSTAQNPSHQYTAAGQYTVALTVTGSGDETANVVIAGPPPGSVEQAYRSPLEQ